MQSDNWEEIKDIEQAKIDAWRIFEERVMKYNDIIMIRISWSAWFGPAPKDKVIKK